MCAPAPQVPQTSDAPRIHKSNVRDTSSETPTPLTMDLVRKIYTVHKTLGDSKTTIAVNDIHAMNEVRPKMRAEYVRFLRQSPARVKTLSKAGFTPEEFADLSTRVFAATTVVVSERIGKALAEMLRNTNDDGITLGSQGAAVKASLHITIDSALTAGMKRGVESLTTSQDLNFVQEHQEEILRLASTQLL